MRFRRVRFATPPKRGQDSGPLVIRLAGGLKLFLRGRLRKVIPASAERIDMVYPTAPSGRLSLPCWIARWHPTTPRLTWLADMLLCGVPACLALMPFLLFQAPSDIIRLGLIVGTTLLLVTSRRSDNRLKRDESLRIHARFWDRLLRSPPPPADPADLTNDARSRTFQLKQALEGALATASALRRIAAGAVPLAIALVGLTFVPHSLSRYVLFGVPVGAFLAGLLAAHANGRLRARLDLETNKLDRIESRYAPRMPLLRQLGLGESVLVELESTGRRQARRALWAEFAQTFDRLMPAIAAAGALLVTFSGRGPQCADLPALLLFIPAVHGAARFGQHVARLATAIRRIAAAKALILASGEDDEAGPLVVDEVALSDIRFRHDHATRPLIEDVSLVLKREDVVALTGPSGCGKSTLLDILIGLCRPQSGSLSVNGRRCPWESLSAYRSRIARVFQDSLVGSSTIRTAIATNAPDASDADIRRAAADAGLSPAIAALPMGLETLLVEGALPASLLQQVLVAQALAQQPDLIVLDETLSGLDTEVAKGIIAAARRRNVILLYATHREDLAALADRRIDLPASLERIAGIAG
jgi:ABC-type multidrug transport system fused ATPase/permease subunit